MNSSLLFFVSFLSIVGVIILLILFFNGKNNNSSGLSLEAIGNSQNETLVDSCATCSLVTGPTVSVPSTTGKKRALLFGCNYNFPGSLCITEGCVLNGCIDDVNNIRTFLLSKDYKSEDIQLYTDLNTYGTPYFPTKAFFLQKIQDLVNQTAPGDVSFIWYSGHGSQIQNASAEGGYNECWCPPDTLRNGNYLTDIELNNAISTLQQGAKLFIGSDSCHSGTVFDLTYFFAEPYKTNFRSLLNKNSRTIVSKLSAVQNSSRNVIASVPTNVDMVLVQDSSYKSISGLVITISGCQNSDTSADAYENGSAQGAMTWSFLTSASNSVTLQDLIRNMRSLLAANGFTQIPQMETSLNIDTKTNFLTCL